MYCVRHVILAGLGLSNNFPVSSQDMLNSQSTSLVLVVIMDAAITLLCTPNINIETETSRFIVLVLDLN